MRRHGASELRGPEMRRLSLSGAQRRVDVQAQPRARAV